MEKCQAASATTACPTSGTTGKLYWKGTGSDPLAESDLAGNPQEKYIFFNGTRIARRDVSSTGATIALHHYFSDHLGTHAVVENATGTQSEQDIDYYPYGGQQNDYSTTPVAQNYKFNGKERDGESGLDNFGARYDTSNLGRFMTPDWDAKPTTVPYANFGNPQSLNLYSYVENNPTTFGDPDGHAPWGTAGGGTDCPTVDNCQANFMEKWQNQISAQQAAAQATHAAQKTGRGWWASLTGTLAVGVARISPSAARKLWEAANPGQKVPFDTARGRFQDMAHIKALADGGTNAAENLKPQEHAEHMEEHVANGDFARWASRAKDAVVNGAEAVGKEIESDARDSANEIVHDARDAATEVIQNPGEAVRDAATAIVESEESGDIPPP